MLRALCNRAPRLEFDENRFKSFVNGQRVSFMNVHSALGVGAPFDPPMSVLRLNHYYQIWEHLEERKDSYKMLSGEVINQAELADLKDVDV